MQLFQESGPSAMFDESVLQCRMKLNQFSKRIACLVAPVDGILPRRHDVSNNGRTWRLGVVIEVFLDQIRLSNDVVVDEQDDIADGLSQAGVARGCCARLRLEQGF